MQQHVDAHQHYWAVARGDYPWMSPDLPIARDYGPDDLAARLQGTGISQTVLVQAAPTVAETEYLLKIADRAPSVARVVGWIDFEDPAQVAVLDRFAAHPKFAGVRPMIQDIADVDWMLRDQVQWAFEALIDRDLTFDGLGFPWHMKNFHTLLMRYPEMRAVLDHCLKPQIDRDTPAEFAAWADGMAQLAGDTQALCKLSGLVTEAQEEWSDAMLTPYVDHVLATFGPRRVMWGSDWPVVELRCGYGDWLDQARRLTGQLGEADRAAVFGGTARRFYRIGPGPET